MNMINTISSEKSNVPAEEKKKYKWGKKEKIMGGVIGFIFLIIIIAISGGDNKSTSTPSQPTSKTPSIGEEGIINFRDDKSDCSGEDKVLLGTTKEAQDKVGKTLLAKDEMGIAELLITGEAFGVAICTKAKVIDSAVGIRQVRILEGENLGKSGWLPYEWIK